MKRRVRLFIGGLEVEFKTVPDILYNFKVDDITNPSAVKNSYSKTVTIPGTKQNNRIFDGFFLNDYKTQGTNFDASKKTEFTIYIDNEVYETGYVKLDKVKQNKHYFEYDCTLFGGLGEFFYNLTYKDSAQGEDERMKLSDLDFYADSGSSTPLELGFQITKETVKQAWDNLGVPSSKWDTLNFTPAYNGLPSDFDADKCLMNLYDGTTPSTGGTSGPVVRRSGRSEGSVVSKVTTGGTTYTTYGGYAVAELSREYTGAEMRDFRSYLQRPVLRVKNVIEAMCRPEQNGGFDVELDPDWFNQGNEYWNDLWVTMPMLSSLEYVARQDNTGTTVTKGTKTSANIASGSTKDPGYEEKYLLNIANGVEDRPFDMRVNLNLKLSGCTAPTNQDMVLCAYYPSGGFTYPSAVLVQLVAYDAFGNAVAGSPVQYITSAYGTRRDGRQVYANFLDLSDWQYSIPYGNEYAQPAGNKFTFSGSYGWKWNGNIQLNAKDIPAGSTLKVLVTELYKQAGRPAGAKKVFYRYEQGGQQTLYTAYTFNSFDIEITDYKVAYQTNEGIRTGVEFTKKQLLDTDYSPSDFLLSYMKIFGLYAIKDPARKKISILSRHNFFKRSEIVDVQDLIDRQSVEITPLVFNAKWYDWNLDADESEYGKAYEDTYGKPYGRKKINTGYNFNKDTKEVLDGNIFKNAVQVLERSNAFCYIGEDKWQKSWMMTGYKYNLYATNDASDTYEMDIPASSTIDLYSGFTTGYMYYDMYDKVQLHSSDNSPADGANVLLIRGENISTEKGSIKLKYFISDDNSYMSLLNDGRPCWLYSTLSADSQGNSVCIFLDDIPYFSRYKVYPDSGFITRSLDFGKPDEIYIPGLYYRPGSTIYEEFWQDYISDLYDKDSRVMKCKMLIKERPTVDWLRRFYYFDNALWRMLSIEDYNAAVEKLTTVQFVRVQDINKYDNVVVSPAESISITLSENEVGAEGGTIYFDVAISNGGDWYLTGFYSDVISITGGTGNASGTWEIPANYSIGDIQRTLTAVMDGASASATLTQKGVSLAINGPMEQGSVPYTGGTRTFIVTSPDGPWTAATDYTGIITSLVPSAGTATTGTGVTVTATISENNGGSTRQAYVYVRGIGGAYSRSSSVMQLPAPSMYITAYPSYVSDFPSSGGTLIITVDSSESWRGYTTYPDRVTISPSMGNSGVTQVTATVQPNTGLSRYMQLKFYRENSPASDPADVTIWQNQVTYISVTPSVVTGYTFIGGSFDVDVYSIENWSASTASQWVSVSPSSGASGWTTVTITVDRNTDAGRYSEINFARESEPAIPAVLTLEQASSPNAPLVFEAVEDGGYVTYGLFSGPPGGLQTGVSQTISASTDGGSTWQAIDSERAYFYLNSGDTVMFKGDSFCAFDPGIGINGFRGSTAKCKVYGRLDSLSGYGPLGPGDEACTYMFCYSNIVDASGLIMPDYTFGERMFERMFEGCTYLVYPPSVLPALFVEKYAYLYMFNGCSSLIEPPEISMTGLTSGSCAGMFEYCTSLETAPDLLPETLGYGCYDSMFMGCTSLTKAPDLLAENYVPSAYSLMFAGCSSLNSVKCLIKYFNGYVPSGWLDGVSANGTFTKASGVSWSRGINGIPNNWTVLEE